MKLFYLEFILEWKSVDDTDVDNSQVGLGVSFRELFFP